MTRKQRWLLRAWNFWPPFIGMGIRIKSITENFTSFEVEMKLRFWNKNIVGTQFGGSLYAMCDPFFMVILLGHLGKDYIVWDKGARIDFRKPGRTTVRARFSISPDEIERIRSQADEFGKIEPIFTVDVKDTNDVIVATVEKRLYVRRKENPKVI